MSRGGVEEEGEGHDTRGVMEEGGVEKDEKMGGMRGGGGRDGRDKEAGGMRAGGGREEGGMEEGGRRERRGRKRGDKLREGASAVFRPADP